MLGLNVRVRNRSRGIAGRARHCAAAATQLPWVKQSRQNGHSLDCFAPLAMTRDSLAMTKNNGAVPSLRTRRVKQSRREMPPQQNILKKSVKNHRKIAQKRKFLLTSGESRAIL
ncbi:MAG: hypothetical protein LBT00_12490 [Spirochaetaceae bacterium]|nr:hypothetical protein [Spirochaetaceae bacterium]